MQVLGKFCQGHGRVDNLFNVTQLFNVQAKPVYPCLWILKRSMTVSQIGSMAKVFQLLYQSVVVR